MIRITLLYAFLFCSISNWAQSIHQEDLLAHPEPVAPFIPAKMENKSTDKANCTLTKSVFGWHPYWMNGAEANYQWDLLSDLCFFSYEVDPATGNALSTHGFSTNSAVTAALANSKQVHLCVTLFSSHATFFGNATAQNTLISNLVNLIQTRGAHGINIDFEGVPASQSANFTNFMTNLGTALHTANATYKLSLCLYAVDWGNVFNEATLNNSVDFYTLMGYDYYYSGSTQAGPVDPQYGFTNGYDYSLSRSISYYLNAGIPKSKLILGIPYYGREWETTSNAVPGTTTGNNVFSRTYDFVKTNTSGNYTNPITNTRSDSKAYIFQNAGTWRQCFISEENELKNRYEMVNRRGLKGIGIWTLGYDDGYTELWTAIQEKLTDCRTWACSDTIYDEGGPEGNYYNSETFEYTIEPSGATAISAQFIEFSTELNTDTLWIYDGASSASTLIGTYSGATIPPAFTANSGKITLKFKSNGATRATGWKLAYNCIQDNVPPQVVATTSTWLTENNVIQFTETDNIGVDQRFWVAKSLVNSIWTGNQQTGHASDDFATQGNWIQQTGNWTVSAGSIIQTDENLTNTNLSLSMPLTSSDEYVFHWKGSIAGIGTNRRAGMHFMCSDLTLPNRGNSYFSWFRVDSDVIQLYEVANDVFSLVASFPFVLDPSVSLDSKITYSIATGKMEVYVNNTFVGSWTDTTPLAVSSGISLRSGNASFNVEEVNVYVGRSATETILVGNNGHFFTNNPSPTTPAGRISNIVIDAAKNVGESAQDFNVDTTVPLLQIPTEENTDIDTLLNTMNLHLFGLAASDTNSGIAQLQCSVWKLDGTLILAPFPVTNSDFLTTLSGLVTGENYYVELHSINGAGLSDSTRSDGFMYISTLSIDENTTELSVYPNPTSGEVNINWKKDFDQLFQIYDVTGSMLKSGVLQQGDNKISLSGLPSGTYLIQTKEVDGSGKSFNQLSKIVLQN